MEDGRWTEMGGAIAPVFFAGAITADTDTDIPSGNRLGLGVRKIYAAIRITGFNTATIAHATLTVVTTTPANANEIQLVDRDTFRVKTAHTADDLLIMYCTLEKTN